MNESAQLVQNHRGKDGQGAVYLSAVLNGESSDDSHAVDPKAPEDLKIRE